MISIAIDGPASSGKSTVAKIIAKKLGYVHIDTGALYRAIAYFIHENNIDFKNESAVKECLKGIALEMKEKKGVQRTVLNGKILGDEIRNLEVTKISSKIASYACVRDFLLNIQRDFAKTHNVIMDGRDIGTVVLPNATVKIFFTASAEERAKRRFNQVGSNSGTSYEEILEAINKRDYEDTHREIAPLKRAKDSIYFDNSEYTLEQSVEKIMKIIWERIEIKK